MARGGFRPGGGRPKKQDKKITIAAKVAPWIKNWLETQAASQKKTLSQVTEGALETAFRQQNGQTESESPER